METPVDLQSQIINVKRQMGTRIPLKTESQAKFFNAPDSKLHGQPQYPIQANSTSSVYEAPRDTKYDSNFNKSTEEP